MDTVPYLEELVEDIIHKVAKMVPHCTSLSLQSGTIIVLLVGEKAG
jgi:hypothetical protein